MKITKHLFILIVVIWFMTPSKIQGNLFNGNKKEKSLFKIKKIKEKKTFYIIYVERNDSIFKIVNTKTNFHLNCNEIKVGFLYDLNIEILTPPLKSINGKGIAPNLGIREDYLWSLYQQGRIKTDKKLHNNIYIARNLSGLCFY